MLKLGKTCSFSPQRFDNIICTSVGNDQTMNCTPYWITKQVTHFPTLPTLQWLTNNILTTIMNKKHNLKQFPKKLWQNSKVDNVAFYKCWWHDMTPLVGYMNGSFSAQAPRCQKLGLCTWTFSCTHKKTFQIFLFLNWLKFLFATHVNILSKTQWDK